MVELPGAGPIWTVYQFPEFLDEFPARDFPRSERGQVRRFHLAIYHAELPALQLASQVDESDLGGIGGARKHGFAVEHPAQRDAVQPPASSPSIQVSTEWAMPSSNRRV